MGRAERAIRGPIFRGSGFFIIHTRRYYGAIHHRSSEAAQEHPDGKCDYGCNQSNQQHLSTGCAPRSVCDMTSTRTNEEEGNSSRSR